MVGSIFVLAHIYLLDYKTAMAHISALGFKRDVARSTCMGSRVCLAHAPS
jgi:hypothetical protein